MMELPQPGRKHEEDILWRKQEWLKQAELERDSKAETLQNPVNSRWSRPGWKVRVPAGPTSGICPGSGCRRKSRARDSGYGWSWP